MQKTLPEKAEVYAKQNYRRHIWRKIVRVMACAVVFCITYALILPAITMEKNPCDLEEHTHSESCYEKVTPEGAGTLTCTYESLGVHVHTQDCYNSENVLICGQADYLIHEHNDDCLDENGAIVCQLPEVSAHVHTDACYRVVETEPVQTDAVHIHSDDCYGTEQGVLICQLTETEGHTHGQSCFTQGTLVCQIPEQEGHTHGEDCSETVLVCELTVEPHVHGDSCYQQLTCEMDHTHTEECTGTVQVCDLTELAHIHTEGCYETRSLCDLPETEGHKHGTDCYEWLLTCELSEEPAHQHTDECYEMVSVLICELEEGVTTTATTETQEVAEPERELICTEPAAQVHIHSEECFATEDAGEDTLTCTLPEDENHTHSTICYGTWELICGKEEHTHDLVCQNDPEADVETEADWMAAFADVTLTGEWDEDLLSIARSQLGYQESTRNYEVMEDGETIKGYTRYGDWYGMPYGDWCAMFVSFCLNYADIPRDAIPYEASCPDWIEALQDTDYDLYRPAGEYTPVPGDLVFFDWEEDGISDHVGIVAEMIPATEEEPAKIKTIEGNVDDQVAELEYDLNDSTILGYGQLPEKPLVYCCGFLEHRHDASCIDENGELICGLDEHIHTSDCGALTDEEWRQVQQVIALIDEMPSSEEIDVKLMEYEASGDLAGQDVYFEEVWSQVCDVYDQYALLSDKQKACVTNADKLMALEYMWGNQMMTSTYATSYTTEVSGYNMEANNIYPIDGFLGTEAAYRYDGTTSGTYNSAAKNILDKANVIYVDLPVNANGERCSLGNYLLGKNHANLLTAGGVQGPYGVDLNAEWCALRVEKAATEYPGYIVQQVAYKDSDVTRIGRLSVTTDAGFILLIRSSLIEKNDLYIPGEGEAYLHLNKELLQKIKGWTSFESDPGYLPSNHSSNASYVTLAYATLSPVAKYDANGKRIGDAGARSDDMKVVDNIKFKLFDYSEYINKVDRTETDSDAVSTIHSKYRALAKYFYFRGGFESAGKDYGLDVARYTPNVNTVEQDGAGHKLYDQDGYTVNHARVEPNLWNGYPILDFTKDAKGNAIAAPSGWETGEKLNARSLRFLFDQDYAYSYDWTDAHKIATGAVTEYSPTNTILQFDEDSYTYWYDSAQNAVDYDKNAQKFRVRKYTERTSITADWPFDDSAGSGDFLPFNYSNGIVNATYHSGSTAALNPVADSSFRMNDVNYWFGMSMEFSFIQGKDGTVTYTNTSGERKTDPMVFEFSGDDDVWVFIDGVRVLDLGGTHGSVTGIIDFTTGKVTQKLTWGEDPNKSYPTTLKKCFDLAGKSPKGGWDDTGERFADYSVHTLKFFYLERGTAVANCSIRFNLPNFDTPLVVGKTLNPADETVNSEVLEYLRGNTEYSYRALETDKNGNILKDEDGNPVLFMKEGQKYTLVDHNQDTRLGTEMTVGKNGIFKLKHGQQAVFEDILGIAGYKNKYFVIEEILPESQTGHYNKVQYTIDADVGTMMGEADDTLEDFIGYYSPAISAGEPQQVQYTNVVDTETLSVLKITKAVTEASEFAEDQEFTVNVKLDGEYLAADTEYSIDGTEYTVGENGAVTLKAGQTAEILVPVLAGTTYKVEEAAKESWVVTYRSVTTDKDGSETTASGNSGSFPLDGIVHVTVTNSTYQYRVPLTFTKKAMYSKDEEYDFSFSITQTDANGNAVDATPGIGLPSTEDLTITAICQSVVSKEVFFTFDSTVPTGTYYFKLVEMDKASWIDDPSVYIIGITTTETGASITSITKDCVDYGAANNPAFVNYMERNVLVYKTVTGNFTQDELTKPFVFTAVITLNGDPVIPKTITLYNTETGEEIRKLEVAVGEDGTITFTLTHNQHVVIAGIPYGAKVTVTETKADGYTTTYTREENGNVIEKDVSGTTATDKSTTHTNNHYRFTNKGGYELPHTGGAGTSTYTMAGLVLMLFSMAYLLCRPKTRRREEF